MATADAPKKLTADAAKLRDEWLSRVSTLVDSVEQWAQEGGWSTRRLEKQMEDSVIGSYEAPTLLMQEGTTRILLEPIARSAPGTDGVVDLYRMPAYDDIATLYFYAGQWELHWARTDPKPPVLMKGAGRPLSKEAVLDALQDLSNVK
jgi:hypothetical protein